jgi:hypothetical protein
LHPGIEPRFGQFLRRAAEATPLELEREDDPREDAGGDDFARAPEDRETPEPELRVADPRIEEFCPEDEDRTAPDLDDELDRCGTAVDLDEPDRCGTVVDLDGVVRAGSVARLRIEALPERVCGAEERTGGAELRGTAFELP